MIPTINPNIIVYLIGGLMVFLLLVFLISMLQRTRTKSHKEHDAYIDYLENVIKEKTKQVSSLDIEIKKKKENIDYFLNWMLSNAIITPEEHNKLLLKSLPFL